MVVSSSELDRLIFHMPAVAQNAKTQFGEGFAKSIIGQSKRRNWEPSDKQLQIMRRLVADMFTHADSDDIEVIDCE